MTILSYCIFFVNTFHLIDAQIQILASIYFRSYNKIFYHNNCYFSSKKAPKHFCPSAIKSHFYTLTSNPFLNMNLISSLVLTITSCTRLLQIPASKSSIKPSCFSKVRMKPLNNSLFAFLLSICSAMSSYLAFAFSYLAVSSAYCYTPILLHKYVDAVFQNTHTPSYRCSSAR